MIENYLGNILKIGNLSDYNAIKNKANELDELINKKKRGEK